MTRAWIPNLIVGLLIIAISSRSQETTPKTTHILTEGRVVMLNGELIGDALVVKFRQPVVVPRVGSRLASSAAIAVQFASFKAVIDSLETIHGPVVFVKQIKDARFGDVQRVNRRTRVPVMIKDLSQLFTIQLSQLVPMEPLMKRLKGIDVVEYVHEPVTISYFVEPNDSLYPSAGQWNLRSIQAPLAWDITRGSNQVRVGIVDQGTRQNHEDLAGKIVGGDGVEGEHGTWVAGVAGANTDNCVGVASIGWDIALETYGNGGWGQSFLAENISLASESCDVINMSWGTIRKVGRTVWQERVPDCPIPDKWPDSLYVNWSFPEIAEAVDNAILQGVVCVAAAGNDSKNPDGPQYWLCDPMYPPSAAYPASYTDVIAVTGTQLTGEEERFRVGWNYGSFVWVAGPAVYITMPDIGGGYYTTEGTSFSCPLVAGLVGLMLSLDSLTVAQTKEVLKSSADKIDTIQYVNGWNEYLGYGRINAYKALKYTIENYSSTVGGAGKTVTFPDNITIKNGTTFTILPGTTVKFASGKSLTVYGNLVAQGSSSDSIRFTGTSPSSAWGGIVINSGGSANIQYCDISNASTGIHVNGVNSTQTIRHCNIASSANYGIQVSYLNWPPYIDISYNTISGATIGIYLYYGTAAIDHNTVNNVTWGIYGYQGGASWWMTNNVVSGCGTAFNAIYYSFFPLLKTAPTAGGHNRATVGSITLYAQGGSNIEAGGYDGIQGLNSFYGGGEGGQAVAMNYSTIVAQYNWWNYDYSAFADYTSTIDNSNPLDSDPNSGMGKVELASQSGTSATSPSVFFDAELNAARHSMAQGKYDEAITMFSQKFKSDTTLAKKKYALAQLRICYRLAKRNDFVDFLNGAIRPSLSKRDELFVESLELESIWLIDAGLYGNAAAVLEAVKSGFPDRPETYKHALFNLGNLYYSQLGNAVKAQECFEELKAKYPNDMLSWHAGVLLGERGSAPPEPGLGKTQPEEKEPKSFAFLLNYPNPFNPSTTFKYALPAAGEVSLIVYDVLGRELAVVTTGTHEAGYYSATWNAAGTASGIYFARLTVKDNLGSVIFNKVNKLLVVK